MARRDHEGGGPDNGEAPGGARNGNRRVAGSRPVLSHQHQEIGLFDEGDVPALAMPDGYRRSTATWYTRLRGVGSAPNVRVSAGRADQVGESGEEAEAGEQRQRAGRERGESTGDGPAQLPGQVDALVEADESHRRVGRAHG